MKDLEIGKVTIIYDENGQVNSADFIPSIKVELNDKIKEQLLELKPNSKVEEIKSNTDLILASFFEKMNEIELADREEFHIKSVVEKCLQHKNGIVKKCVVKYLFSSIN